MFLSNQKRMAAEILSRKEGKTVGIHRIWVNPDYLSEVADAVQRDDVRLLIDDGIIKAKPIKGTRARSGGRGDDGDEQEASALRNDEKELSENLMISDLLRNDLGRVRVVW
mgnify:CR=1 FL=1